MINKIFLKNIASYKKGSTIETDKEVNLIYGLNGSGKSTLSEYLRNYNNDTYNECSLDNFKSNEEEILVYNENYIHDVFYDNDDIKGIFSLSKENKEAKTKIDNATAEIKKINSYKEQQKQELTKQNESRDKIANDSMNEVWHIKTEYDGGDRVLQFCLEGLKSKKNKLWEHIRYIKLLKKEDLSYSIEDLKKEMQSLNEASEKETTIENLPIIELDVNNIENDEIFQKVITGNNNSEVANLIEKLGNSDWVKQGVEKYLNTHQCPFCQQFISEDIISHLKEYFNQEYNNAIEHISSLEHSYENALTSLNNLSDRFENNSILLNLTDKYINAFNNLKKVLSENLKKIKQKHEYPSHVICMEFTESYIKDVNDIINKANNIISKFNTKISNIEQEKENIKEKFWNKQRELYNIIIDNFNKQTSEIDSKIKNIENNIQKLDDQLKYQQSIIIEQQKNVINIQDSVININRYLLEIGITDFKIKAFEGAEKQLYYIVRDENQNASFKTLSEGERMLISFLYFIEQCKGLKMRNDVLKDRIVVIDDPISSLSNIYIYNISVLIKDLFYPKGDNQISTVKQVFILTHSLYFLYELISRDKYKGQIKLFRIVKKNGNSEILEMKIGEIQNDYQEYWAIIRENKYDLPIIANCMRNIIEYFFGFISKESLNNVFQKSELKENRFKAFVRYINRESHSDCTNITYWKEFNINDFQDAFELVFTKTGYEEHYKKMMMKK